MKKSLIILLLVCFSFCFHGNTQAKDTLSQKQLKDIIEAVSEEQYVRIPKKDFDAIVENKISVMVNKRINTLIAIVAGSLGLLSGLAVFQNIKSRNSMRDELEAKVSGLKNAMASDLREHVEKITESNIDPRFKNYERFMELEVKSAKSENKTLLVQIQEEMKQVKEQRKKVMTYLVEGEFQFLSNAVNTKDYSKEQLVIGERLLKELENNDPHNPKMARLVDLLSYLYYYHKNYKELNLLIDKYKKLNLSSNTFINAALTAMDDYHNYASEDQKIKALDYLDKSLQITQSYGEALGLKLELFMMDYTRSDKKEVREEAVANAKNIIDNILNSASDIPSYETVYRISRDIKYNQYQHIINALYNNFKEQMNEMLERANRYDLQRGRQGFTLAAITTQEENV